MASVMFIPRSFGIKVMGTVTVGQDLLGLELRPAVEPQVSSVWAAPTAPFPSVGLDITTGIDLCPELLHHPTGPGARRGP